MCAQWWRRNFRRSCTTQGGRGSFDAHSVKRHFQAKLCVGGTTGRPGPAGARVLKELCVGLEPGDASVSVSVAEFRCLWGDCIRQLGLGGENYLPYAFRRGGATLFFRQTNNLPLAMLVGRWAHMRTARIYIEDGLMVLAGTRFSPGVKRLLAAGAKA
ncbi:unnamed protein product [Polarella glacialis]|uniref:Uncharacterized protein n=1 Tax=Polarella glacialis TaxID=89957 RepID=A0A813IAI8_POLGL|nr:unnamed protein product [Polarella glacialis]